MRLRERLMGWLRVKPPEVDPLHSVLPERERQLADRLAKVRHTSRSEVMRDAYKRADELLRQ